MSKKFGGFLGSSSGSAGPGHVIPRDERQMADYAKMGRAARLEGRAASLVGAKPCFAIALDATGSMGGLLDDARRSIGKILEGIYTESKMQVRVRVYAYRDYDVSHALCDWSDLSSDPGVWEYPNFCV